MRFKDVCLKRAAMPSLNNLLPSNAKLLLVGGGKMGLALLQGWLSKGLPQDCVAVQEPHPSADLLALGVKVNPENASAYRVIIIAVKPQMAEAVLPELSPVIDNDSLILSLMAGLPLLEIARLCTHACSYVRTMPNTPSAIGQGITALFAAPTVNENSRHIATALMGAVGETVWLDEEDSIDAVTALSGSGPAYVFHLVEAMTNAGIALGLAPDTATQLARATVKGSGAMLGAQEGSAETLRRNVTSPGGTTAAALDVLMDNKKGLSELMLRTMRAAHLRAKELASNVL